MLNALRGIAKDSGYTASDGIMADHSDREARRVSVSSYV